MSNTYSVIIPCYNSASYLDELVVRIMKVFNAQKLNVDIILINDASPDNGSSWSIIRNLSLKNENVTGIDLQFNVGQFRTLMVGFEHAKGDYIITMDDDLQHPPEEIPKLIKKIEQTPNVDVVIGKYYQRSHSIVRNLGRMLVNFIFKSIYEKPNNISSTSFRILKRNFAETLLEYKTIKPIMGALILQSTHRIENVEVKHHPRQIGRSGYSLKKLINATLDNVIDSTVVPLRFFSILGIIISLSSSVVIIYYLLSWFIGNINVPGFVTTTILITFFGGLILLGIGILGEYISRVVVETAKSPRHVIREISGNENIVTNKNSS